MSRTLGSLARIIAVVVASIAVLGITEWACGRFLARMDAQRIGAHPASSATRPGSDMVSGLLQGVADVPVPLTEDADLLWRNRPSIHKSQPVNPRHFGHHDLWTIETNSRAYRGPEVREKSAATYRILCIGDSITFGFNVDQAATFASRLEQALASRFPGKQFEVINAGVPGWSWVQGLRFLEIEGLALEPDLIIAAHGMNDQSWRVQITDNERMRDSRDPLTRLFPRVAAQLRQTNMYRALALLSPAAEQERWSPGCEEQMRSTLASECRRVSIPEVESAVSEFHRLTEAAHVDLLVLNFDFLELGAVRAARSATERARVPFVDFAAEFDQERRHEEIALAARLELLPAQKLGRRPGTEAEASPEKRRVVLRVLAPDSRSAISVKGASGSSDRSGSPGEPRPPGVFTFDVTMHDDGTDGDEIAGDRVFSASVDLPPHARAIEYAFHRGQTAEFESVGPIASMFGDRVMKIDGDWLAPVQVFGEMYHMAERAHPDADGHAMIARRLLDELGRFESFRRFTGETDGLPPRIESTD